MLNRVIICMFVLFRVFKHPRCWGRGKTTYRLDDTHKKMLVYERQSKCIRYVNLIKYLSMDLMKQRQYLSNLLNTYS